MMSKPRSAFVAIFSFLLLILAIPAISQTPQFLKRTITKTDRLDFGAGGTIAITGAPVGSLTIVGNSKNEIEITAVIEIQAVTEADLSRLEAVTTFVTQESQSRFGVVTIGTHNKLADKKLFKKFPKNLVGLPFRIDYTLSVPQYSDLEIDGGSGDLTISGVDGSMRINYLDTNAKIALIGGSTTAIFGTGSVDISVPGRGWRGRSVDVQLAKGDMTVHLPTSLSAELDATILRSGAIENTFLGLKPRVRKAEFTDRLIVAKAGNGGIPVRFSVGDGILKLMPN